MLWIELAGGIAPIIYTSKRCLKLVPKEHLIARYALPIKAGALRKLDERPDQYKHVEIIRQCLIEMAAVLPFPWVYRKRLRKLVKRKIDQSIVEKIANERT